MFNQLFKAPIVLLFLGASIVLASSVHARNDRSNNDSANVDLDIRIEGESKEVGLKRLEIIEKYLSSDLLNQKRALVGEIESDYNKKITSVLKDIISPVIVPKVSTHLNVNFFSEKFDSEVKSETNLSVLAIINKSVFANWEAKNNGRENAIATLKEIIFTTFRIPQDKITIVVI